MSFKNYKAYNFGGWAVVLTGHFFKCLIIAADYLALEILGLFKVIYPGSPQRTI